MLKDSIARRYSTALFSLAREGDCVAESVAAMDAFVGLLERDETVREFFRSPVVPRDLKLKIIGESLQGRTSDLIVNFLALLVRKRRETLVFLIAAQLRELYDREAGRWPAAIETARPLAGPDLEALRRRLSSAYGRTLMPSAQVDRELLGGITLLVGGRYVDASVSGRLKNLRRHLLAGADAWTAQGES
ncbi:MAG: ATP synthase F1 subunit delta [Candidatus Eremiobacteraeota bacterium]|nr:ATP synthase F1 subunit delta [Candidatus Eremiobacteraeota bacterium]MBC5828386.1 ATP synthase F1 subunit delta [Candidatus Eremiobacteraeota bacterium]